jgi:ADP-heptose:LPS heptosyltransferase
MKGICLIHLGHGFGDALMLAHLTNIVNDNGFKAVFKRRYIVRGLVDVPLYNPVEHKGYRKIAQNAFSSLDITHDTPVILKFLEKISRITGNRIEFKPEIHNHIPVVFYDIPKTSSVDVIICSRTGKWTPYKVWPHFKELKKLLKKEGITYFDMHRGKALGIVLLNYVKRAKVYLGLDTGASHYVSRFANGKGLIIQSGYSLFRSWAYPYAYEEIVYDVPCSPCMINWKDMKRGVECQNNHECMNLITPREVLDRILNML